MSSSTRCPLAGCGEEAAASAPQHDPFTNVVFEQLATPTMTSACADHAEVLWTLYRSRVALALFDGPRPRASVPVGALNGVAWTLNSHNDATSKSVAALLDAVGTGQP